MVTLLGTNGHAARNDTSMRPWLGQKRYHAEVRAVQVEHDEIPVLLVHSRGYTGAGNTVTTL